MMHLDGFLQWQILTIKAQLASAAHVGTCTPKAKKVTAITDHVSAMVRDQLDGKPTRFRAEDYNQRKREDYAAKRRAAGLPMRDGRRKPPLGSFAEVRAVCQERRERNKRQGELFNQRRRQEGAA